MSVDARRGPGTSALAALLFVACAPTGDAPPATSAGEITVDAARIWYQSIGSGEPIVAVHGGPGLDHSYFVPWLEPLGAANQLILYDQRGLGRSSVPLDTMTIRMTRFLDDIDGLRTGVAEADRVTLLAHSWGTIPAMLYAMRWPERVERLILVSPVEPGQRYADQAAAAQAARRPPEDVVAMDSIGATSAFQEGDPVAVNRMFFHVFRGTFAVPAVADSLFEPGFAARTARQGRAVAALLMTPLAGLDFWDQLGDIDVPVLIVHGTEDPIPMEMARDLAGAFPDATLVEIEAAGHFPFIENPDPTFAAIRAFLEERTAAP